MKIRSSGVPPEGNSIFTGGTPEPRKVAGATKSTFTTVARIAYSH